MGYDAQVAHVVVHGHRVLSQRSVPGLHLDLQEGSDVIAVTSSLGSKPKPYWGVYAASKAALAAQMRTLAQEFAPLEVRINMVSPGSSSSNSSMQIKPNLENSLTAVWKPM